MNYIECAQCSRAIENNSYAYVYDGKIFDTRGCIVEYLLLHNKIGNIKLKIVDDGFNEHLRNLWKDTREM